MSYNYNYYYYYSKLIDYFNITNITNISIFERKLLAAAVGLSAGVKAAHSLDSFELAHCVY